MHDGWSVYDRFWRAIYQQCNAHLLNRCKELLEVARRGAARFPLAIKGLLQQGLAARDRFAEGKISRHGLLVTAGRLTAQLGRVAGGHFTHDGNRTWLGAWAQSVVMSVIGTCLLRGIDDPPRRVDARVLTDLAKEKKLATQLGTQIHEGTNCPEADQYLRRAYRPGWTL